MSRGTGVKRSPLHGIALRLGADFGEPCAGWLIAAAFGRTDQELAAARRAIGIVDESCNGKLMLQAESGAAEEVVSTAFGIPRLELGQGTRTAAVRCYRLRPDLFFIGTTPGKETPAREVLEAAAARTGALATVTDTTHGNSELRLIGPRTAELMSKLCGLDFDDSSFPEDGARLSSVAKTTQLILRRDVNPYRSYSMLGASSLAAYLWDTIVEAGREYEIAPLGLSALCLLEETAAES